MAILLLAETSNGALAPATAKAVTAAQQIGGPIHVLVVGPGLKGAADQAAKIAGVEKVLYAEDARSRPRPRGAGGRADRLARARL